MPRIVVHQHLFGPLENKADPTGPPDYGTLGCSEPDIAAGDLALLERAGRAALHPADGSAPIKPVRKTFFRLPSGRFVVGRTQFTPACSPGSPRYVTHHHIATREAILSNGAHPFSIFDVADWVSSPDNLPHRTEPVWLHGPPDPEILLSVLEPRHDLLATLAAAAVAPRDKPLAIAGDERLAMDLLRILFRTLPIELRIRLTFSSYFYQADNLRHLFSVVMVPRREVLRNPRDFYLFDLEQGTLSQRVTGTPYTDWLVRRLAAGQWERIDTFNRAVDAIRVEDWETVATFEPDGETFSAIWQVAGTKAWRLITGSPKRITEALHRVSPARALADELLSSSPDALFGDDTPAEEVSRALALLRKTSSRQTWSTWWAKWKEAPALARHATPSRPWWRKLV